MPAPTIHNEEVIKVNTIEDRIKWLRKDKNMTQQEFADRIGTPRANIAGYERGIRTPSEAMISLICSKFAVNESWLRSGEGDPYIQLSRQAEIARIITQAMRASPEREALICALSNATDEQILAIHDMIMAYAAEYGTRNPDDP